MTFLSLAIMTYLMQGSGNIFYRSDEEYADIEDVAGGDMVLESEETKVEDKPDEHYFGPGIQHSVNNRRI